MPHKTSSRASYKGQLTTLKRNIERYENDPQLLTEPNAKSELKTQRELGEAEQLISKFSISDDSYARAWNRLKERYDDKLSIMCALMDQFLDQPSITQPNVASIRRIQSNTSSAIDAMEGMNITQRDPWLIHWILGKFDRETKWLWAQENHDISTTIWEDFDRFLNKRCRALEHTGPSEDTPEPGPNTVASISSQLALNPTIHSADKLTSSTTPTCLTTNGGVQSNVLFATAVVTVLGQNNQKHFCRVLLDPASQVNIISTSLCQLLKLPCKISRFSINGVNDSTQLCKQETQVKLEYEINNILMSNSLDCLVMPRVTTDHPNWEVNDAKIKIASHLKLADPHWNHCQRIDLLIGGANSWDYFGVDKYELGEGQPRLLNSVFGWLVVGPCFKVSPPQPVSCNVTTLASLDKTMKQFWEMEDIPKEDVKSFEKAEAEKSFDTTVTRTKEGRYQVQLPLNENIQVLHSNRNQALRQFSHLQRRLDKNLTLKELYLTVFREYLQLGIIERVPANQLFAPSIPKYYMPHHCVIRENALFTKVRPVFNASSVTASGVSLNDCLHVGPIVQPLLISILWRFRMHKYALTCDIVKMYLQVELHPSHRDLQRFVIRLDNEIEDFRFTRVCFGVASSPFLATRVLMQLTEDEDNRYPAAAKVIRENTYVDDCLLSAPTVDEVLKIKEELKSLFLLAGMELSKFQSNSSAVMKSEVSSSTNEEVNLSFETKTLEIVWLPSQDCFQFRVSNLADQALPTKHHILSTIARIYDPCGFVGPILTRAKLIMQATWIEELDWRDEVSQSVRERLGEFISDLPNIEELKIPRWYSKFDRVVGRELHAFSDASGVAYGAVVFLVTISESGERFSRLVSSKSRISPLDKKKNSMPKLTIPKAELCAAVVAVDLMISISQSLAIENCNFWTDSAVVLCQIHQPKPKQDVFVRNRAKIILSHSKTYQWNYVSTHENPADLISRGTSAKDLLSSDLWWSGPKWLCLKRENWPPVFSSSSFHMRSPQALCFVESSIPKGGETESQKFRSIYEHLVCGIGTFTRMVRTLAWCIRASDFFKSHRRVTRSLKIAQQSPLTVSEICKAETLLIKWAQHEEMPEVVNAVAKNTLDSNNKLKYIRKLRPFLDSDGVLRVGGRLHHSNEPYDVRHPKILPNAKISHLIAVREHVTLMHTGPQLVLSYLRQKYWPIRGRNLVRRVFRECVVCKKVKPPSCEQLMGELPACRVSHIRPFVATGVYFTGHIMIRRLSRGKSLEKAYVVVFVCMSVKAVHLELVTSLSTESFIAALRRFVARRGIPNQMFSDNGTNFVGSDKELKTLLRHHASQERITNFASSLSIQWHFNAPAAPSHGGLWESAVRSFKHHFRRTVGQALLTYEEMVTVLAQIEAILNSRPLVNISEDCEDPVILTPGNFLIGIPPLQLPDPSVGHLAMNKLSRWQLCQRIQQDFAARWKKEYLSTLQIRSKWDKKHKNLKVGNVVLLIETDSATTHWPLGVVREVHPGVDGLSPVCHDESPSTAPQNFSHSDPEAQVDVALLLLILSSPDQLQRYSRAHYLKKKPLVEIPSAT
ncbi:uncharacterized protein LOC129808515 [Phlebotomus papatasi]|uniref:uncharacterized protein LOC129808515 n=1 Tax=Phlebotomus papatasi TaxID=29031 RepID=UPI002483C530|nr:uncharacterized protein LOC129808515 [Phlebotomus papatasi]